MERDQERVIVKRIKREVAKRLAQFGFKGNKKFVRKSGEWFEAIVLHKFRFGSQFRVHAALRHTYDKFDSIGLNGPNTDSHRGFECSFSENEQSIEKCIDEIVRFTKEVVEPWFEKMLLLSEEELCNMLKVRLDEERSVQTKTATYKLLGFNSD